MSILKAKLRNAATNYLALYSDDEDRVRRQDNIGLLNQVFGVGKVNEIAEEHVSEAHEILEQLTAIPRSYLKIAAVAVLVDEAKPKDEEPNFVTIMCPNQDSEEAKVLLTALEALLANSGFQVRPGGPSTNAFQIGLTEDALGVLRGVPSSVEKSANPALRAMLDGVFKGEKPDQSDILKAILGLGKRPRRPFHHD